jgi:hypothetical protein
MTEVPKIVYHRLRAAGQTAEGAHPEADMLAAFAEQALSPFEREGVLEHLALCGDCRETVALALPALETAASPVERAVEAARTPVSVTARQSWLGWGNLRWSNLGWAALAAGIAVAVLIVRPGLEHRQKPNQSVSSVATQTASPAGAAAPTAQVASRLAAEGGVEKKGNEFEAKREISSNKPAAALRIAPSRKAEEGTLVADNLRKDLGGLDKLAPAPPPAAHAFEAPSITTEAVEVSGVVAGADAELPVNGRSMARIEAPPIEKAKPARGELGILEAQKTAVANSAAPAAPQPMNGMLVARAAGSSPTPMKGMASLKQSALWMIKAGVLQRSLDGGQSWQTAVRADHALLCSANRAQEVWAGGQAGTLEHSADGGVTWNAIEPSFHGQSLKSDITGIEMRDPAEVVLTTADHEVWSSVDGGKTWQKK